MSKGLPQEFDRNYVLENYLQAQALSVSNTGNSTVVTDVESTKEPLKEDPSNEVTPPLKDEPENTLLQLNPSNEATRTSVQKSMLTTPKSLNPFGPEFEARVFLRSEEPCYLAQTSDPSNKSTVEDSLTRLADILSKRRLQDSLPLPEPEVFSGDLLHYPVWLKSFVTIIEGQTERVFQRLYYLGKYTAGEPKEAISGLLLLETAEAYKQAKRILSNRFGNPFLIADAYRKKINEWPKIPPNDGTSLRKFSDFLIHCHTAMNSVKYTLTF